MTESWFKMKIVLCRHGETDFNVEKRLQGTRINHHINERGKKQAELISQKLKDLQFNHVFSSPLIRCKDTVEIIAKNHDNKTEFRKELEEVDLGIFSGMNAQEIEEKYPGKWHERVDSKYDFDHYDGESYESVDKTRIAGFLKEIKEKYSSRTILIVTHMGIARLIIGSLLGLGGKEKMEINMPNDCIYFIDYLPHKTVIKYYLTETREDGEGYLKKKPTII